ncbi:MAG TPA: FHA domain-containing protein [Gemmataceae bacterium]|nr:FHA domain-containing protein [Gemmataceae bacterium]
MKEVLLRSRWLKGLEGSNLNQSIAITHFPALVGRSSDCNQKIGHPLISRHHCTFELRDGQIWIQDLGSLNGTFLNGQRVQQPQPLHDGDRLDLAFLPYEVCLPKSPEASIVQPDAVSQAQGEAMRPQEVLVVDDNAEAAETLAVLLAKWGHHVHVAHNGPEAVAAARIHHPDTVFLDLRLERENGCQVAQQLRAEAGLDKAVMVGITGYGPDDTLECLEEGKFQHLLTKPVATEDLQEVLSRPG